VVGEIGVSINLWIFPHLGAMGHRTLQDLLAELLQIAQPPKMHAFMSGVLELKSNLGQHLHEDVLGARRIYADILRNFSRETSSSRYRNVQEKRRLS